MALGMSVTRTMTTSPAARRPGTLVAWLALALLALAGCSSAPAPEVSTSALYHFRQGNADFERHAYPDAIRSYREAIKADPTRPEFHYNLGLACYAAERYDFAVAAYRRALELRPDFPEAHLNLALAYDRLYDIQRADEHYNAYRRLVATAAAGEDNQRDAPGGTARAERTTAMAPDAAAQARPTAAAQPATRNRTAGTFRPRAPPTGGAPAQGTNSQQGSDEWWTQDRFLPNR